MTTTASTTAPPRARAGISGLLAALFSTKPTVAAVDFAVIPIRIVLAWIFIYYGAGKLFGAFGGPGIHATALYMSDTAHLHPGGLFAVLGGLIELGGAIAVALGVVSRLAALALFGDQVMAMITVTWANGLSNSLTAGAGYQFNMALAVLALAIVALGPGRLSADHVIERRILGSAPAP
jgi:putative oxidoreductase